MVMDNEQARILIVDDNELNRDLLSRRLQRYGYQLMMAENGRIALEKLRLQMVDLILLDIMMPEMNGFQVLESLKSNPEWHNIPVIVISAADDMDSIIRGIELGAEDYLPKPYNALILKARIGASLEKKRLRDIERAHLGEMAIMQEIGRQLNATLDVQQVMAITLGWALRQSGDQAGFIGRLNEGRIQVIISQGYTYEISPENDMFLPEELPAVPLAMQTRKAEYVADTQGIGLLVRAQSQIAIPMCRGAEILAVIVMENTQIHHWLTSQLTLLNRLSDHAAMAIANAQMYAAVQSANLAKTEFVSFVSHELKTPMTSIKGYADLLISGNFGDLNQVQQQFLQTIRNNVERMSGLVSDLTDISRIESGHLRLEKAPVSLSTIVYDVVNSARAQIEAKAQELILDVPEDLPLVFGDRARLNQIVANLLSNAHKYTPEKGRIIIRVETLEGEEVQSGQPMVVVAVRDTGLGIPDVAKHTIFEKFMRVDDTEVRKAPGTGLGLSITKSLVELHNGRIWFDSIYRRGTTFYFAIPAIERAEL